MKNYFKKRNSIILKALSLILLFSINSTGFSQNWNEIMKIVNSDRAIADNYGWAVDVSGNYAVVGAYGDDEDENGANLMYSSGSVYVLERNGAGVWSEVQKIVASDRAANDNFGMAVSISGNYLVVGVFQEDEDENGLNTMNYAGSAYIFERNNSGLWVEVQKIVASDRAIEDYFGHAVAISGDKIVIGAFKEDEDTAGANTLGFAGSAYVFERDNLGSWNQVQKLVASDRYATDWFGWSVSIDGDQIAIGAPQENEDENGLNSVHDAGSVYIFNRNGAGVWSETQKIVSTVRAIQDEFGRPVIILGDYLVAGAYREDEDASGSNTLNEAGAAYVFKKDSSGTWSQVQKLVASDRAATDRFSYGMDMSEDHIVVGAWKEDEDVLGNNTMSDAGSIYVFEKNGSGVWQEVQKVVSSDRAADDRFGYVVVVSGNTIIAGAYQDDEDANGNNTMNVAGSAYIFEDPCVIDNSTITNGNAITANQTGATYQWIDCNDTTLIPGATNASYAAANGNYAVIITLGSCSDTSDCVSIGDQLNVNFTVSNLSCNGDANGSINVSSSGGIPPLTYQWDAQAGGGMDSSVTGLSGGTYFLTITDASGFSLIDSITITEPSAISLSATAMDANCDIPDGDATVTATGGTPLYAYLWNDGATQTTVTATGLGGGNYSVVVTDSMGCQDSVSATVANMPLTATVSSDSALCQGETMQLTAGGGSIFAWSTGETTATITVSPAANTTYTVVVSTVTCPADTATTTVTVNQLPVIQATPDSVTIAEGASTQLNASGASTYAWTSAEGLSCSNCANPEASPTTTTTYWVTGTDAQGCSDITSVIVTVNTNYNIVYLPNTFSPVSEYGDNQTLQVFGSNIVEINLVVFDRWGEKVYESTNATEAIRSDGKCCAYGIGWDGTWQNSGTKVNVASFVYILRGKFKDGKEFEKHGNITLIK